MYRENWQAQSACSELSSNEADRIFFLGRGGSPKRARLFCASCPVIADCRDYAILYNERGIWGGMLEDERDSIAEWAKPHLEEQARQAGRLEVKYDPIAPPASCEDPTESPSLPDEPLDNDLNTYLQTAGL